MVGLDSTSVTRVNDRSFSLQSFLSKKRFIFVRKDVSDREERFSSEKSATPNGFRLRRWAKDGPDSLVKNGLEALLRQGRALEIFDSTNSLGH